MIVSVTVAMFLVAAIVVAVRTVPPRFAGRTLFKWIEFGIVNVLLVIYELKAYWKLRKSFTFWSIFLGMLSLYFVGLGSFFYFGNGVSMLTFVLAGCAEFACTACVIYWILDVGPSSVNLDL
jgi:hypothetical protein